MNTPETPLESWKEIGAYLQRDATTARRWEKEEGLPVHRHSHKSRSSVYAYPSEVDAWRALRRVTSEPPPLPMWKNLLASPRAGAFVVTILASVLMAGSGIRAVSAQSKGGGISLRQVCAGANCDGQISPDGRSLLIQVDGNICIRDLATGQVRQLTHVAAPLRAGRELWAPDGKRVTYSTWVPGSANGGLSSENFIVNADGTGTRFLYRGGNAESWSPDGKRLLIEWNMLPEPGYPGKLVWVTVADGTVQALPKSWPKLDMAVVSPDGRYIAFNASKDKDSQVNLYVMASDGSGETPVSASTTEQEPVAWTPDGRYLLFIQYAGDVTLWAVPFSGGKTHGVPGQVERDFGIAGPNRVDFRGITRSGALYYQTVTSTNDLYTASMDPATGKVTSTPVLLPLSRTGHNGVASWSPDGRRIVHGWWLRPGAPVDTQELSIYSLDTGKDQRVASGTLVLRRGFCWGADGASLLFSTPRASDAKQSEPVRFDLSTGQVTPLFPGATSFAFSSCSDDALITTSDNRSIKVRNFKTGSEAEIHKWAKRPNPARPYSPFLSHDGKRVAFREEADNGSTALYTVSSEGGPVRELTRVQAPTQFSTYRGLNWSPDDRYVYFLTRPDRNAPFELMRVPGSGGAQQSTGLKWPEMIDMAIAPDGKSLVFSAGGQQAEIWAMENYLPRTTARK